MPEDNSKTVLDAGRRRMAYLVTRVRGGLASKSRKVIVVTALAGITGVGLAAANLSTTPTTPTSADALDSSRNAAAMIADRSARDAAASASASASASADAAKKAADAKKAAEAAAAKKAAEAKKAAAWVSPLPGAQVTSCYGQRWGVLHAGIDFAAAENTPEHAVGAGTVVAAGWNYSGYGISVLIDHGNGTYTHYAHMNKTAVKAGQKVTPGQVIGYEGSTGDSTGPHLHFEVWKGMWGQINPASWLKSHGIATSCS
ncbi:M23 family metallopeptidase [Hamadaea sp. NPDC051192]|uniref:M23 family metallopeptidase n=1 Tax=Hamadaea sp. NPDC051192 TaxID=3154940 RepID=UPI00342D3EA2